MKNILCGLIACAATTISASSWSGTPASEYGREPTRSSVEAVLAEFSKRTGLHTDIYLGKDIEVRIAVGQFTDRSTLEGASTSCPAPATAQSHEIANVRSPCPRKRVMYLRITLLAWRRKTPKKGRPAVRCWGGLRCRRCRLTTGR